jgi:hypothetical protein
MPPRLRLCSARNNARETHDSFANNVPSSRNPLSRCKDPCQLCVAEKVACVSREGRACERCICRGVRCSKWASSISRFSAILLTVAKVCENIAHLEDLDSSSVQRPRGSEDGPPTAKKRKRTSDGFARFSVVSSDDEPNPWPKEAEEFLKGKIGKMVDHLHTAWNAMPKDGQSKATRTTIRKELQAASEEASDVGTWARDLVHWAHGDGPKPSLGPKPARQQSSSERSLELVRIEDRLRRAEILLEIVRLEDRLRNMQGRGDIPQNK